MTELIADRYRTVRLLGRGGMSDVYEAIDEHKHMHVALKMVRSADPELARRLAQEARALEGFAHPGLVGLLDTGVSGDQAYLVMDLVDGVTLAETIRGGRLGTGEAATLGATVADALAYVHARGVVHRDVKPANILLTSDGEARLGDFGVARLLDASTLTLAGTTLGTTGYMAPEQLEDHRVGPSADVWSLGIVLLECLTGRRVYDGTPSEVIARRLAGPVPIPDDLPVPWKLLLTAMLDHRPDQRLDAAEVAALLGTSAFRAAWEPTPSGRGDPPAQGTPDDLTALSSAMAPDPTAVLAAPDTQVASSPPTPGHRLIGARWRRLGALGVLIALCAAAVVWIGTRPSSRPHATGSANLTRPDPTAHAPITSTTVQATTTTTTPNGPTALAALVRDAAAGVAAGTVDGGSGQAISKQAEQAVTDEAAGKLNQATNDLQQAAMTIADGIRNSSIQQGEGAALQADLSTLAAALGLSAASSPPTAPPGPGAGHGHGPGAGKGD